MNLTKQNWPGGWNPSQSEINGDPNSLLRMDNLQQDETGATTLVKGITQIGAFSDYVADIYSKVIGANEIIWVSLNANGSAILRSISGNFNDTVTVSNGNARGCFGDCLGEVLCISGNQLKKDNGTTILDLGLQDPTSYPAVVTNSQPFLNFATAGTWTAIEGSNFVNHGDAGEVHSDTTTLRGILLNTFANPIDTTMINGQANANILNDTFTILVQLGDSNYINDINVQINLGPNDYYSYDWDINQSSQFVLGLDVQSTLTIPRGGFTRSGTDQTLDWKKVISVQITATFTAGNQLFLAGGDGLFGFRGGATGNLNGAYTYAQVDAYDNGIYVAKSAFSPFGFEQLVFNGSATVTPAPPTDPQVNKHFIFRRSVNTSDQLNPALNPGLQSPANNPGIPVSFLNTWYLVGTCDVGGNLLDNLSDTDAIQENILPNQFLTSMQNLNDTIIGIEGLYNERMLYMSSKYIYLSDQLNPDAVDSRYTLKLFGDPTETNLWIKKLSNNVLIAGTTKNLYEISGTLLSQPDGSLDATITPIGEAYPPLCYQVAATDGNIFYVASDGIRATTGSNSIPLSAPLNLLFQNQTRHGVPPVAVYPNNNARYPITVGKGRLYVGCPLQDGTARLFIYTFKDQTWRMRFTDPITLFTTQKDRVLAGYGFAHSLYALEEGIGGVVDGGGNVLAGVPFTLLTTFDNNGQPRNRKDTFTLKIICDTGGDQVDVYIAKDGGTLNFLGSISCTGLTTNYFQLNNVTLGFRYQIQLVDHNLVTSFRLEEYTIEYEPRPEQQTYLRLLPTNLGSYARKRFTSFAYIVDTLGHSVTFTPYIDNTAVSTWVDTFNTATKLTHISFFGSEEIGTDIGGIFTSPTDQPFEFYQVNLEETVSEKLPTPCTFLVIPNNNYGTPNRKRHTSYKFVINTRGANVVFTPSIDGISYPSATYNTPKKQTVEYFFTAAEGSDFVGIDIGGTLQSAGSTPFEFYGVITPQQVEELPPRLEYYIIPPTNLGSYSRKRVTSFAMVINTNNQLVNFTPLVDGVPIVQGSTTIQTTAKTTFIYYYNEEIIGTDFSGILSSQSSTPFEFYGVNIEETVSEKCPTPMEYLVIPSNDYGSPNRKRHTSYKFQINTRGNTCTFTPTLDGILQTRFGDSYSFSTTTKQIVEYFFPIADGDVIAKEVGGILAGNGPFEFYQVITPQRIEELPPRLDYYRIPNSNFGHAGKKRFRTIPFVIDTYGQDVSFTPIIDGVTYTAQTFNTTGKITVYYYFVTDMFGIDIGGIVQTLNGQPFEFYNLEQPENVEVLPVPKKYDQLGAIRFDKIGKLFSIRIRLVQSGTTTSIPFQILTDQNSMMNPSYNVTDNNPVYSGTIPVVPNVDQTYEVNLPKSVNGTIIRLVLGPTTDPFHRYDCQMKVSSSGMESDSKWVPVR